MRRQPPWARERQPAFKRKNGDRKDAENLLDKQSSQKMAKNGVGFDLKVKSNPTLWFAFLVSAVSAPIPCSKAGAAASNRLRANRFCILGTDINKKTLVLDCLADGSGEPALRGNVCPLGKRLKLTLTHCTIFLQNETMTSALSLFALIAPCRILRAWRVMVYPGPGVG